MQKRSFVLLLAVTVLAVAAAAIAAMRGDRYAAAPVQERRAFPGLAARLGDLAWMRIVHGSMSGDLGAIGGHWAMVEKGEYPAAPGRCAQLLLGLAGLTLVEPKTKRTDLFGRLGLDDPRVGNSTVITCRTARRAEARRADRRQNAGPTPRCRQ